MSDICEECGTTDGYILQGCCDGKMCACMAQPVSITNCKECNPHGTNEMSDYTKEYNHLEYVGTVSIGGSK